MASIVSLTVLDAIFVSFGVAQAGRVKIHLRNKRGGLATKVTGPNKEHVLNELRNDLRSAVQKQLHVIPVKVNRIVGGETWAVPEAQNERKINPNRDLDLTVHSYDGCSKQLDGIHVALKKFADRVDLSHHHVDAFDTEHWSLLMALAFFEDITDASHCLLYQNASMLNVSLVVWSGVKEHLPEIQEQLGAISDHKTPFSAEILNASEVGGFSFCPYKVQGSIWRGASSGLVGCFYQQELFDVINKTKNEFPLTYQSQVEIPALARHPPKDGFTTFAFGKSYGCDEIMVDIRDRMESGRQSDWTRAAHFGCKNVNIIDELGSATKTFALNNYYTKPFCPFKDKECPDFLDDWPWARCGPAWPVCYSRGFRRISLDLDYEGVGDAGAIGLAVAIEKNTALKNVWLRHNNIGAAGATVLATAIEKTTTLETVWLDYNNIGDAGATALGTAIEKNTALKNIWLNSNNIGDAGATALATAIEKNTALKSVWLDYNNIGHAGATALATAIEKNTALETVWLNSNNIGDAGATALATAIEKNTALKDVWLNSNNIGRAGATALATAIEKNTALETVRLDHNNIGDAGATALATAIEKNTALENIWLNSNNIGDAGATALATAIEKNTALKTVWLNSNNIGAVAATALATAIQKNTALTLKYDHT